MTVVFRERPWFEATRRIIDLTIAFAALVFAAPILFAAAVAIKLEDGGSVFFTQQRVGRFERLFVIYKLRTMRLDQCGDVRPCVDEHRFDRVSATIRCEHLRGQVRIAGHDERRR